MNSFIASSSSRAVARNVLPEAEESLLPARREPMRQIVEGTEASLEVREVAWSYHGR
jgi:hypothetical protein